MCVKFKIQNVVNDVCYALYNNNSVNDCWLISDTHFNHKKIQEYCNRPDDWQDMIISNWNKTIDTNDTVLHLGDFAFGNKALTYKITKQLVNGDIYMIKGNHDRHSKMWYKDIGITVVPSFMVSIEGTNKTLYFTHRKMKHEHFYGINIHGHIHQKGKYISFTNEGMYVNVCLEQTNYFPVKLSTVLSQIKEKYNVRDHRADR